jgi:hypothetical protein
VPHLMVHLVDQARALGPMYLHEMWTYERLMSTLNCYVLNRACPEGSMVEAYCTEEVVECCQDYLVDKKSIGLVASRHTGRRLGGKGKRRKTFIDSAYKEVGTAHFSVLHQIEMMALFIKQHLNIIRTEIHGRSEVWIMKEHKKHFTTWLMNQNIEDGTTLEEITLKRMCMGPSAQVTTRQAYEINGYTFYASAKDKKSVYQNSGVQIDAISDTMGQKVIYYGVIDEIGYGLNLQIPILKCKWVKHAQGVEVDNYGLRIVDLANVGYKDDPWVLT